MGRLLYIEDEKQHCPKLPFLFKSICNNGSAPTAQIDMASDKLLTFTFLGADLQSYAQNGKVELLIHAHDNPQIPNSGFTVSNIHINQFKANMSLPIAMRVGAGYKYGFNGQEVDPEIKGSGNSINYLARIYDPRLGRFLSIDPLTKNYPWYTPYQFAGNKPIWAIDVDGLEEYIYQYTLVNNDVALFRIIKNSEIKPVTGGWGAAVFKTIDKRTGEPMNPKELGMVQYQYLDASGKDLQLHKTLNGEKFAKGAGEMMPLHQENYNGSIYISAPWGKDAKAGEDYDYRREPTDLADAAALEHDKNYDKVDAAGVWDALTKPETIPADIKLLGKVQTIIDNYGNDDYVDPYTNKPISERTLDRAKTIKNIFTPIVTKKILNTIEKK